MSAAPDEQLDKIIRHLDDLPQDLKDADPATYPHYEEKLSQALDGLTTIRPQDGDMVALGAGSCIAEIAKVVVTYGIPATKVLKWLKEAKAIWGGVKGIITAIRSGAAATELGGEAASLLEAVLGVKDVKNACF